MEELIGIKKYIDRVLENVLAIDVRWLTVVFRKNTQYLYADYSRET